MSHGTRPGLWHSRFGRSFVKRLEGSYSGVGFALDGDSNLLERLATTSLEIPVFERAYRALERFGAPLRFLS